MAIDLNPGLEHAWDHFVRAGTVPRGVRRPIASSWLRCRQMGLDPLEPRVQQLPPAEFQRRLAVYRPLLDMARPFLQQLVAWQQRTGMPGVLAVLADSEGVVLEVVADPRGRPLLVPGQRLAEESAGTSAVGLALLQGRLARVLAAEHYYRAFHPLACAAVPVTLAGLGGPVVLGVAARDQALDECLPGLLAQSAAALARVWHGYRRSLRQQALLAARSPWPLVAVDEEGRVVECNPASERELALPRDKIIGRSLAELGVQELLTSGEHGAEGSQHPLLLPRPGGGEAQVFLAESAPLDDDGVAGAVRVIAGVNITGYRRREEHAEHQQRLALVERLASLAVHEIRNPLAAIRVTAELAAMTPHGERRTALMQQIIASIDELEGFLDELLALARPEQMTRSPIDVRHLIQRVVQLFEPQTRSSRVVLQVRGLKQVPAVLGNEQLLRHAFINLIRNAFQAMPHGGALTIRLQHRPARGCLLIRVSDTGTGIPAAYQRRLFTGAVTTKGPYGVGLGLLFTHRIITETHCGRIWFRTREGAGTTFYIQLPVLEGVDATSQAM